MKGKKLLITSSATVFGGSILATVLFPVFAKAEEYSGPGGGDYISGCGTVLEVIASDHNGQIPNNYRTAMEPYDKGGCTNYRTQKDDTSKPAFAPGIGGKSLTELAKTPGQILVKSHPPMERYGVTAYLANKKVVRIPYEEVENAFLNDFQVDPEWLKNHPDQVR